MVASPLPTDTIAGQSMAPRATLVTTPSLRYWRTQIAVPQRELAEMIGVALSTVQRLETGGSARLATVRRLAGALGVTPAELMGQPPDG